MPLITFFVSIDFTFTSYTVAKNTIFYFFLTNTFLVIRILLAPIPPWKIKENHEISSEMGSQTEVFQIYGNNFVLDHHDYVTLKMNTLLLTCKNVFYKNNIFAKWTNYREIFGPSILFKRIKSKRLQSQPISNIFYNISESFTMGNFILPVNNIDHFICKKFVDISMRILLEDKISES